MTRKPDWLRGLTDVLNKYANSPFEWGKSDCLLFAADCVQAITGEDFAEVVRGRYVGRVAAFRLMRALGAPTVAALAGGFLTARGHVEIDPREAITGDVGVTSYDACCVKLACGFVARTDAGTFILVEAVKAWRV